MAIQIIFKEKSNKGISFRNFFNKKYKYCLQDISMFDFYRSLKTINYSLIICSKDIYLCWLFYGIL